MKLTLKVIEGLTCPPGQKDALVSDDEQRGLYVRVGLSARAGSLEGKSYLAKYALHGARPKVPLGSCSALSVAKAREATRAILGDLAKGLDVAAERKRKAEEARRKRKDEALTLAILLDQWTALHLTERSPTYAAEAVRALRVAFEKHLGRPAAELTREQVVRVLDRMKAAGKPAMAASVAAYGRAAFSWAIKRGSIAASPFDRLPTASMQARERVLTDDEIKAIWQATDGPGPYNAILRMLLATGQRRDEVAGMRWDELSPDRTTWTIPSERAKNKAEHIVPLSPQAQAIIASAPRLDDFVFAGLRGQFSGFGHSKARLDQACGVANWRVHDLRRTVATGLQKLGVRLEVTEAVLNHISGSRAGIVGVYQRHEYTAEKREALNAWGERLQAIIEGRAEASNVTAFRRPA